MRAARVDPATADAGAVGFRLGPRINAAGRLCHPQEALELLLTEDRDEAWRLAQRLEELNRDRQQIEDRILREAVKVIEAWPEARRRNRGYVVAGEGWHEGVIGIVASRLVERYQRPVVLIASAEPDWKGSGRSIAGFDLHAALGASAEHLTRWGGHAAAAGLSIRGEDVPAFAERFEAVVTERLVEAQLEPVTAIDAIVPGERLTLALCAELERLAPFGLGNPAVTLLLPAAELGELATVGEGKHLRFRVRERGRDAGSAIAFRLGPQLDRFRRVGRYDVAFRLQENHWNGTVAPQLVVRRIFDAPDGYEGRRAWLAEQWRLPEERPGCRRASGVRRARARAGSPLAEPLRVVALPCAARRAAARAGRVAAGQCAAPPDVRDQMRSGAGMLFGGSTASTISPRSSAVSKYAYEPSPSAPKPRPDWITAYPASAIRATVAVTESTMTPTWWSPSPCSRSQSR